MNLTKAKIFVASIFPKIRQRTKILCGRTNNIHFAPPNYLFRGSFDSSDTIIDAGCGFDADFSVCMIKKFGLHSIGIDPTRKHQKPLFEISQKTGGLFKHELLAISSSDGKISFNESLDNVSGSILKDHRNVKKDHIQTYEVDSVSLRNLPDRLNLPFIKYIKLDLEGAEYDLVKNLEKSDLEKYGQIFIEFHHHCVSAFSKEDTLQMVEKIKSFGFASFTADGKNYLFYRTSRS